MKIEQVDKEHKKIILENHDYVKVTKMGNITELQYLEHRNSLQTIQKISKNEYVVLATGEVKTIKNGTTRADNINGLRKTFKKLRYLINSNFYGSKNELFITLTYKENMQDVKRLYRDFDKFVKKMKRKFGNILYISVVEPQQRGAFHYHVLIKFLDKSNKKKIFIKNEIIEKMWGQGFVNVQSTYGIDNIGAYLTAYLTDIEINDDDVNNKNIVEKEVNGKKKKFIKGGRLHLYPAGMNYYRHSRNVNQPVEFYKEYGQIIKNIDLGKSTFKNDYFIKNEKFENAIHFEQFNRQKK